MSSHEMQLEYDAMVFEKCRHNHVLWIIPSTLHSKNRPIETYLYIGP